MYIEIVNFFKPTTYYYTYIPITRYTQNSFLSTFYTLQRSQAKTNHRSKHTMIDSLAHIFSKNEISMNF